MYYEPECPIETIYPEDDLPTGQEKFIKINADLTEKWPVITHMIDAPEDAEEWEAVVDKLHLLEE